MFNNFFFSFRNKILLIILMTSIIPISVTGYLANQKFNQLLENQAEDITLQALRQSDGYMSMYFSELELVGIFACTNDMVLKVLSRTYASTYDKVVDANLVGQVLNQYIYSRSDIERIDIFGYNGFSYMGGFHMDRIDESQPWVEEVKKRNGQPYWFASEDGNAMVFARTIASNGKSLGIIRIVIPSYRLEAVINKFQPHSTGFLFLVDSARHPILGRNQDVKELTTKLDLTGEKNKSQYINFKEKNMFVTQFRLERADWQFVSVAPRDDILKGTTQIRGYFLTTVIVILLITLSLGVWVTRYFTKPIKQFISLMYDVEKSNFTSRMVIKTNDEIGMLAISYNRMVQRVRDLISTVYEQQRLKNEAQWSALQAQINPHFLYNTLDSINWIARMNKIPEISKMITALSMLFKLSLSKSDKFITVEEELMYIKYYAQIQETRFSDRIRIHVDVPEQIRAYSLPRFILQPLVENAVVHGLEPKEGPGEIHIKGGQYEDKIFFIIQDNGVGIPVDRLKELLLAKEHEQSRHLGLSNVDERIKLLYGQEWGLKIDSIEHVGTIVEVWLLKDLLKGGANR
ncbi:hypothetical protein ASG89_00430 [Paenibacillus sp. Soil766]|uniref:cache domain-containing sensor histidine kinase n=1 Tax=Paenibacillus sp. Soil766 TaxID=1736404 RepID=UPI00070A2F32|nr:sensor histidine kinase [Paenibacillus sp. Soil766]KRF10050.1 hypothetical protein ASG89_00430 [Paenibacillus sp. Soil766]